MKSAAAAILALSSLAAAAEYPRPTGYVNDFAGRLSPAFHDSLESRLRDYQRSTTMEVTVVTVPSLQNESIETYSIGLFRAWSVGKRGVDNGVLFLWAPAERKVRITVGRGLDNVLTHPVAQQIIEDVTARFRVEDFEGGVTRAVDEITSSLGDAPPRPRERAGVFFWVVAGFFGAIFGGLFLLVLYAFRRAQTFTATNTTRTVYRTPSPEYDSGADVATLGLMSSTYDSSSSSSSFDSGSSSSDSGSFGGGDTSGGGASGDY